jgi:hypothetical protein
MVLHNDQNVVNSNSLFFILSSYWIAFSLTAAFLVLALIFLCTSATMQINLGGPGLEIEIPLIIIGILLSLPLFLIFMKNFKQKDDNFFLATLREKI